MVRLVLGLLLCCSLLTGARAATGDGWKTLPLHAGQTQAELAAATRYAIDAEATATPAQMFAAADAGERFAPLPDGSATFGFVDGAYWFHLRLINVDATDTRWLLVLDYALLDEVDLYVRDIDGHVQHAASGDQRPFAQRALRYREPNFWLTLTPGRPLDLLLRVQSRSSMQVPLTLYTPGGFLVLTRDAQFCIGVYYGILIALLFYNLILFASLRDRSHFLYSLHVAGLGLVLFCLNGLAFEYFWPDSPWLANAAVPTSMAFAMLAMHLFARDFLELPRRSPLANRLLLALIGAHLLMLLASPVLPYRMAVLIGTALVFPGVAAIIAAAVTVARRGFRPALLFLVSWAMLLAGTLGYAAVTFGLLPKTFATEYGMQIGSAAEMIFLSFALAYRWAALRDENERIVTEANERTHALSGALQQLGDVHARLRELSARDGLTGVFNRRHFEQMFAPQVAECLEQARPYSLLIADLDHFKRVNDDHGHLAGDDCLRSSAAILQRCAGDRGAVARFGGEEFVVLLPDSDELGARRIAEAIRQCVAAEVFTLGGDRPLRLTVSIGAATVTDGGAGAAEALLRLADEALYEAKRGGRNRVVQGSAAA